MRRRVGLALGPALMLLMLVAPTGLEARQHRLAAIFVLVVVWWVTEAIPLAATAVLGPTLAVVMGVAGPREAYASLGHPIIFLFLGSFLIARAMEMQGLDRRIALAVLSLRWVGESPGRILIAFGAVAFVLSMWISNTATAAMMMPIAGGVLATVEASASPAGGGAKEGRFATGLMLMVAWSCNAGGIATPVGTPPNLIALGMLEEIGGIRIGFFQWMMIAFPVALVCFVVVGLVCLRRFSPEARSVQGIRRSILAERAALGRWSRGEVAACGAFAIAVVLWVAPGLASILPGVDPSAAARLSTRVPESVAAVLAASVLFVIPSGRRGGGGVLRWRDAAGIDWGTILLFGGGLAMGSLASQSGLSTHLGDLLPGVSASLGPTGMILIAILTADILTEFMSNTAMANLLVPVFLALGMGQEGGGVLPGIAAAVGCSMAFALPVATPPNAIIFAGGRVPLVTMLKNGLLVDLLCALAAWGVLMLWRGNL